MDHFRFFISYIDIFNVTSVLLPGKSHGWRSLVGCSPRGQEETTEWLHFPFSLSCLGEGNGNPLQCSCLENPRVGGAWWAAVYGVEQSQTWLKRLNSSSSSSVTSKFTLVSQRPWRAMCFSSFVKGRKFKFREIKWLEPRSVRLQSWGSSSTSSHIILTSLVCLA